MSFIPKRGGADDDVITSAVRDILDHVGEDYHRPGLIETPRRVRDAWEFMCRGYRVNPDQVLKLFEDGASGVDEMVIQKDIPLWSTCEHHMLPFFGVAHVAYIPNGKILGLSKFSRLIDVFARRLQVQERLTGEVADALMKGLNPLGVGVQLHCRHTCMEARGIQRAGSTTTTTALRGSFKTNPDVRSEFLASVRS
jgi:GTP cyclohydrolase I